MTEDKQCQTQKSKTAGIIDPELKRQVKETMIYPSPERDPFWKLEAVNGGDREKKRFLGLFSKRTLKDDLAKDLREAIAQAPGNNQLKIQKLRKRYPDNGLLVLFSGMCIYGMALNSSQNQPVLEGFRMATKEAGTGLLSEQISLMNLEVFLKIYFAYLDRLKRGQIKVYEEMCREPLLDSARRDFLNTMQVVELLFGERKSIQKITVQLKKRVKSSMYATNFEESMIREAVNHILKNNLSEKCRMGTASECVAFIHAILSIFSHIPMMFPLVDKILAYFPESHKGFLLRKISINTTRNFIRYRIAAAEGDKEMMAKVGKTILKENSTAVSKLEGQSLYQPYETDPYFNIAFLADLSHGLYTESFHQEILAMAIDCMGAVIARDMSKNNAFTDLATKMTNKLDLLKSSQSPAAPAP